MDPNATLSRLRIIFNNWEEWGNLELDAAASMEEVSELFLDIDNWLTSGGFRPDDWS